ncbi:hypothetical protein T492DRAFT_835740 [Pavlovales sp. CCMP2436]|nr:hypothetical protein T492DRAFT_835740 [Pavlovales sp. CCMP2436]
MDQARIVGIVISISVAANALLVLAQSFHASGLVTRWDATAAAAAGGGGGRVEVARGATAIAALLLGQLRFMHTLTFAVALPAWYTAVLAQFKWTNFVVVVGAPLSGLGSTTCEPPARGGFVSPWMLGLDLMGLASPEAYFVSVTAFVATLLVAVSALNLLVWLVLARADPGRQLPATWSPPRLQARVALAAHSPLTLACVLILASDGCSPLYTAAASVVLALCTLTVVWVAVAIRRVVTAVNVARAPLVAWSSPASQDPERVRRAGEWLHAGDAGWRLKRRLGLVFADRQGGAAVAHLPVEMLVQMARDVLFIISPICGEVVSGAVLLALDSLNILRLIKLQPFNVHLRNRSALVSAVCSSAQVVVFFVAPAADVPFWIVLLIQGALLLLVCGFSYVVSRLELEEARYVVAHGVPWALAAAPKRREPCGDVARAWKKLGAWLRRWHWRSDAPPRPPATAPTPRPSAPAGPPAARREPRERRPRFGSWPSSGVGAWWSSLRRRSGKQPSGRAGGGEGARRVGWRPASMWLGGLRRRAGAVVGWLGQLPAVVGRMARNLLKTVCAELELPEPKLAYRPPPPPAIVSVVPQQIEAEEHAEPTRLSSDDSPPEQEPEVTPAAAAPPPLARSPSHASLASIEPHVVHDDDDGKVDEPSAPPGPPRWPSVFPKLDHGYKPNGRR